ncbi:uncharacterized protein LOC107766925 [Nicotiana tabacum]|uniref:Uncharacterized protein LOC107766925 n=1 Tax=Nicotiana tabacum TaxID=4097 RepID=A0AC58UD79_TOBAC
MSLSITQHPKFLLKKALLAWDRICYPRIAGGFNILDITTWNKGAISKLLWNLCKKADKLWVRWIHRYYGKNRNIFEDVPKQASWIVQKILKATKYFDEAGYTMAEVQNMERFSTTHFYIKLRDEFQKVIWRKLVCNNIGLPRWIFTLRMAAHGRLYTRDRLFKLGVTTNQVCPLCDQDDEYISHLFFICGVSATIWKKLLMWLGIRRPPMNWEDELQWAKLNARGRSPKAEVFRIMLAAVVYHVWKERNYKVFRGTKQNTEILIRQIIQEIHYRGAIKI